MGGSVSGRVFKQKVEKFIADSGGSCAQSDLIDMLIATVMKGALKRSVAARVSTFLNRNPHDFIRTPSPSGGNKITMVKKGKALGPELADDADWAELKARLLDMLRGMNVRQEVYPNHVTALALMEIRDIILMEVAQRGKETR
jgi:hypothetical protein